MSSAASAPLRVLHVAEKPSMAAAIASHLSGGRHHSSGAGGIETHEFEAQFRGAKALFKVTAVRGHIFGLDFAEEFQSWDTYPGRLFAAETVKVPRSSGVVDHLRRAARGCGALVLWLDCDPEGENICFEVMHCVMSEMPRGGQRVWRARFSAVSESAIRGALATLGVPNEAEAAAVDARQELDLKIGVAFTRLQTDYFRSRFKRLDSSIISYGPCQTPTLGFVVKRRLQQLNFTPEQFWTLHVALCVTTEAAGGAAPAADSGSHSTTLQLTWERQRLFDQRVAAMAAQLVRRADEAVVSAIDEREETRPRPLALNTVAMLKAASAALGLGAARAMKLAEDLYLRGYLSYPRTESTAFPRDFDFDDVLRPHSGHPDWGEHAEWLRDGNWLRPRRGVDAGDHPPLTPTNAATSSELHGEAWRLYRLVALSFLAALCPDARVRQRRISFDIGGEVFFADGCSLLDAGWYRVMPHRAPEEVLLPPLQLKDALPLADVELEQRETAPPQPISESELIGEMEANGIGTDASIASHISNIESRRYVRLVGRRQFEPTALGLALVQGYCRIDAELVQPVVRRHVEEQLQLIAKGEARRADVVRHCLDEFLRKFDYFAQRIGRMEELFALSFGVCGTAAVGGADANMTAARADAQVVGNKKLARCGFSGRYLEYVVTTSGPGLYNPTSEQLWTLPCGGSHKPYGGRRCPLCNFELLIHVVALGRKSRGYPLCPYCFHVNSLRASLASAPAGGMQGCSEGHGVELGFSVPARESVPAVSLGRGGCPLPEAHPVVAQLAVCRCPRTGDAGGWLLVDARGGTHVQLVSTRSSFVVELPAFVRKLAVGKFCGCSGHACRQLVVEFHRDASPLAHGETQHAGCLLSDALLQSLWEATREESNCTGRGHGGKRQGGGRRRGGRGRS